MKYGGQEIEISGLMITVLFNKEKSEFELYKTRNGANK